MDSKYQWFPAFFAAAVLLFAVLAGIPVGPAALELLFLWFGGSWALWGAGGFPRRKGLPPAAVLIAAALLLAWPLSAAFSAQLSEPAYRGEEAAYRLWRTLSGTAAAPYYSRLTSDWFTGKDGYTCEFYETKDVRLDWENVPDSFAMQRDWNRRVYETYAQKALAAYTGTPGKRSRVL